MLLQQRREIIGNRIRTTTHYIREHWHEWLWLFVSEVGAGETCPHFYLPVYRSDMRAGFVAWIIPLAPFVLVTVALYRAFWTFWRDCLWAVERWKEYKRP